MHSRDVTHTTARDVVVESDEEQIPAGVDGESLMFPSPVRCSVRPGALRVRVPRQRPGVAHASPPIRVSDLVKLAARGTPAAAPSSNGS